MFSYGKLCLQQRLLLKKYIPGKTIVDLGSGGHAPLSQELLRYNPSALFAVDKERPSHGEKLPSSLFMYREYFEEFYQRELPFDLAFLSWPPNYFCKGLIPLLEKAEILIFLGKNNDGTSCGNPQMFLEFLHRPILEVFPFHKNEMMVYGPRTEDRRDKILGFEFTAFFSETSPPYTRDLAEIKTVPEWFDFFEVENSTRELILRRMQ